MDIIIAICLIIIILIFSYFIIKLSYDINYKTKNIMKLDEINKMINTSGITMSSSYVPTNDNDIITKKYLSSFNTDIDLNSIMRTDNINQMNKNSGIKMNNEYEPIDDNDIITKKYLNSKLIDASSENKGFIKLAGNLSGSADKPIIATNSIKLNQITKTDNSKILIGSNNLKELVEYNLGENFSITNDTVNNVNNITLNNIVKTINGVFPDSNGNIAMSLGKVYTGPYDQLIDPMDDILYEADLYIVSNNLVNPDYNGRLFIFHINPREWIEINGNLAVTDTRYLRLTGNNNMSNNSRIIMPTNYDPPTDYDIITKKYVDDIVSDINVDIPSATTTSKGIIKLSNHLAGTADNPSIADYVIKLSNFQGLSKNNLLIGTNASSLAVREIKISDNFSLSNNILELNNKLVCIYYLSETQTVVIGDDITFGSSIRLIKPSPYINISTEFDSNNKSYKYKLVSTKNTTIKISYSVPTLITPARSLYTKLFVNNYYLEMTSAVLRNRDIDRTTPSNASGVANNGIGLGFLTCGANTTYYISVRVSNLISDDSVYLGIEGFILFEEV